ncbi:C2H2-type domain-containing protein [Pleurotus pulmonarius]
MAASNFDHALPDSPIPDICNTWIAPEYAFTTTGFYNAPKTLPVWGYHSHSGSHSFNTSTTSYMNSDLDADYHFNYLKGIETNDSGIDIPMCVDPVDLTGPSKNVALESEELRFEIYIDSSFSSANDAPPSFSQELSYPEAAPHPSNGSPSPPIDKLPVDLPLLQAVAKPDVLVGDLPGPVPAAQPVRDDTPQNSLPIANGTADATQATSLVELQEAPPPVDLPLVKKEEGEFLWLNANASYLQPMPCLPDNERNEGWEPTTYIKRESRPSSIDRSTPAWSAHGGIELEVLLSYFASYMAQNATPSAEVDKRWMLSFVGKLSPNGEKLPEYRCYVNGCTQVNKRRDHILTHLNSHLDYRPFRCQTCPANFLRKNELKRHELSHTGVRPHVCPLCSVSFNRRDLWKRHLKRRHDVDPGRESYNQN